MIRRVLGKVKRFLTQDVSMNEDASPDSRILGRLVDKASPTRQIRSLSNKQLVKSDEALFYINKIKNSITVNTGEYEAITNLFNGAKIYIDTRDVSISPHLMFNGIWEEGITRVFRELVDDATVFFDVGANFGYYSVLAGEKNKGGSIHIFEANPDIIPLLDKSMSVNGLTSRSSINQVAVTDRSGQTAILHRSENLWGGSSLHSEKELKRYRPIVDVIDKTFKVKTLTIDDYVERNKLKKVDLMKIDVEGLEDVVYRGIGKTLRNNKGIVLLLEFTTGGAYSDEQGFFKELKRDFKYISVIDEANGSLTPIETIEQLYSAATSELVMLLMKN